MDVGRIFLVEFPDGLPLEGCGTADADQLNHPFRGATTMKWLISDRSLRRWTLAACLAGGAAIVNPAIAGDPPATGQAPRIQWRKTEAMPAPVDTPRIAMAPGLVAASATLTNENLVTCLTEMGLTPKPRRDGGNNVICEVVLRQGTWSAPVQVSVSPNGGYVWLVMVVKPDLPEYESIPGPTLARLLEVNDQIGPMHFAIPKGTAKLTLNYAIPNRSLTPDELRAGLEAFVAKAIATEPLWGGK
jgi:hypothetical protein